MWSFTRENIKFSRESSPGISLVFGHDLVIRSFAYHLCKVFCSPCFLYNRKKRLFRIKHIEFLFRLKKNDSILYVADLTVLGKGSTILNTCETWMYWCIKTIHYLQASTLNDQLIKRRFNNFAVLFSQKILARNSFINRCHVTSK